MTRFIWDDKTYSLQVPNMDNEHKNLISLMAKLETQHEQKASPETLLATFKELAQYTVKHFEDEENYMASIQYPKLDTHKIIHQTLLKQVGEHLTKFEQTKQLPEGLFGFLSTWLKAHIQGIDMQYSEFCHQKKAA